MKKIILSLSVAILFGLYVWSQRSESFAVVPNPSNSPLATDSPLASSSPLASQTPLPPTPVATPKKALYRDGQYTGSVADAFFGNLQVKAIIQGGAITDVQFLQSPNAADNSIRINGRAMPILKQEAIQTQSANVAIVSGATQSSGAFRESLAVALGQARN